MKNKKNKKTIIIKILIIIFFILLILCEILLKKANNEVKENSTQNTANIIATEKPKNIKNIIEKYNSNYLSRNSDKIYVEFEKDLYDDNANSNKEYFESLIKELSDTKELKEKSYYLIDKDKDIKIHIKQDGETYDIKYNDKEDFYNEIDGKEYSGIEKVEIVEQREITVLAEELRDLTSGNMFFRKIKDKVGTGIELENGYTSFYDGALILKILNGKVRNAVFTKKYTDEIVTRVTVGMTIDEIKEKLKTVPSKEDTKYGYILYRTSELYIFFYEDEVSAYGYTYDENTFFENYLEQYLEDKDFNSFIQKVTGKYTMYNKNEYDLENKYAHITYPSLGIEINIENNNPKGITLYNNYYFTEKTKEFVKDGKISVNTDEDLLELMEKTRRSEF